MADQEKLLAQIEALATQLTKLCAYLLCKPIDDPTLAALMDEARQLVASLDEEGRHG